ncbi:MAG: DUF1801 domain-containing protein [Microbacterium sp.]
MDDWRLEFIDRVRGVISRTLPDAVEEAKWRKPANPDGVATWSLGGLLCTGEIYRDKVKITFARGASLDDPSGLFNAGFGGGTRRAIDVTDPDAFDEGAFAALITAAAEANAR